MIRFDDKAAMMAFGEHLGKHVAIARDELYRDAIQGLRTNEAKAELSKDVVIIIAGIVTTSVIGGPWTVMDEFGTGSAMDMNNPHLIAYIQGPYWNPARTGVAGYPRVGRPKGQYIDIFGKVQISKGNAKGINLEKLARKGKLPKTFLPTPPSNTLQIAIRWMNNGRFQQLTIQAVKSFPWHKYLIVTNTKRG